jgi:hypothetical protein
MNTSVNIASSQDFRLSRALLVYGTTSYQGFPYRHPFVTLHEVIHDDKGAQLAAGQLMTVQMLADLMIGLGRSVPIEILPERVLVRTNEMIVWWLAAQEHVMFFSDRGNDPVLKKMNGWFWYRRASENAVFLVERRFASESSASSPKRSGGLSSRTCRRSCFVHDAAMRANRSSASALIAIADSATAAIFAGNKDRSFGFEGKFIENAKE